MLCAWTFWAVWIWGCVTPAPSRERAGVQTPTSDGFTAEITAKSSSYNLLCTQRTAKSGSWMLLASPSYELCQHPAKIHSWHVEYRNTSVTAISPIIQPLDKVIHQESGSRSLFGSTLHSCLWFPFWLSPLAAPIVLLPVIWFFPSLITLYTTNSCTKGFNNSNIQSNAHNCFYKRKRNHTKEHKPQLLCTAVWNRLCPTADNVFQL